MPLWDKNGCEGLIDTGQEHFTSAWPLKRAERAALDSGTAVRFLSSVVHPAHWSLPRMNEAQFQCSSHTNLWQCDPITLGTQVTQHPTDHAQYHCASHSLKIHWHTSWWQLRCLSRVKGSQTPVILAEGTQTLNEACRPAPPGFSLLSLPEDSSPWTPVLWAMWGVVCDRVKGLHTDVWKSNSYWQ